MGHAWVSALEAPVLSLAGSSMCRPISAAAAAETGSISAGVGCFGGCDVCKKPQRSPRSQFPASQRKAIQKHNQHTRFKFHITSPALRTRTRGQWRDLSWPSAGKSWSPGCPRPWASDLHRRRGGRNSACPRGSILPWVVNGVRKYVKRYAECTA